MNGSFDRLAASIKANGKPSRRAALALAAAVAVPGCPRRPEPGTEGATAGDPATNGEPGTTDQPPTKNEPGATATPGSDTVAYGDLANEATRAAFRDALDGPREIADLDAVDHEQLQRYEYVRYRGNRYAVSIQIFVVNVLRATAVADDRVDPDRAVAFDDLPPDARLAFERALAEGEYRAPAHEFPDALKDDDFVRHEGTYYRVEAAHLDTERLLLTVRRADGTETAS